MGPFFHSGHQNEGRSAHMARPVLLLPHVELLPRYLEYEQCAPAIRYVCDMLPRLLPLLDHPPKALLEKNEKYLAALVFRVKEDSIPGVIRALCSVCTVSKNRQLLGDTLARFCHFLRKQQQSQAPVAPDQAARGCFAATSTLTRAATR